MSNPSVITLAETKTRKGRFIVEDNLGESIHLHLGDIRCDLSIEELDALSESVKIALENYLDVKGFCVDSFSKEFLFQLAEAGVLPYLKSVRDDDVELSKMLVPHTNKWGITTLRILKDSRVIKALNGDSCENDKNAERNYYGVTNQDRVETIFKSVKDNGYPYGGQKIVLLEGSNRIYDGQHRAASLYYLHGDQEVPITRISFENEDWGKLSLIKGFLSYWKRQFVSFLKYSYKSKVFFLYRIKISLVRIGVRWDRYRFRNIR